MLSAPLIDVISLRNVLSQTILGQGSTLHVHTHPSQAGNFTEMLMVEKPTSRKQAQLLSSWYYEQIHTLMSLAIPTPEELREFLNLTVPPASANIAAVSLLSGNRTT